MKREFTFKRLVAAIFMMFVAIWGMNAQDQVYPWHVVVKNANGTEVASHSVELISDLQATADSAIFLLSTGSRYAYPITFTFSFAQREGGGTAIQTVAAPKWNVFYGNSALNFTQQVNNVAIYSVSGVLVNRFNGNYSTSIPVSLGQGLYIVQADGKAAKLLVTSNSSGGTYVQPTIANTVLQSEAVNVVSKQSTTPTPLRAATAALSQYWNLAVGDGTLPLDISTVTAFSFISDTSMIVQTAQGSMEIDNYIGTSFSIAPVESNFDWDLSKYEFWGASYCWTPTGDISNYPVVAGVMHQNGAIIYDFINGVEVYYENSAINPNVWVKSVPGELRRISFVYVNALGRILPGCSYLNQWGNMVQWDFFDQSLYPFVGVNVRDFSANGNTNFIPTVIKISSEGITMSFSTLTGENFSHTFKGWNP